ncbi:MAG: hypothetical protein ACLUHE_08845 [Christensenellales bacterium]
MDEQKLKRAGIPGEFPPKTSGIANQQKKKNRCERKISTALRIPPSPMTPIVSGAGLTSRDFH